MGQFECRLSAPYGHSLQAAERRELAGSGQLSGVEHRITHVRSLRQELPFFDADVRSPCGVQVFREAFGLGEHDNIARRAAGQRGLCWLASDLVVDGRVVDDLRWCWQLPPLLADFGTRARRPGAEGADRRSEVDPAAWPPSASASETRCDRASPSRRGREGRRRLHSGQAASGTKANKDFLKARVLVCIGADDPMIPPEQRADFEAEMREARCGLADASLRQHSAQLHEPGSGETHMPEAIRYSAKP